MKRQGEGVEGEVRGKGYGEGEGCGVKDGSHTLTPSFSRLHSRLPSLGISN